MKNLFAGHAEVIAWWHEGDYQGQVAIAYEFPSGHVALMTDYYGSCSGCDAWEDSSEQEARTLILGLCGGAKVFPNRDAVREWIKTLDLKKNPHDYAWVAARNLHIP